MRKGLLDAASLWRTILLQLVKELARESADKVAARYAAEATRLVKSEGITRPEAVIRATLDMVERKQGWSNTLVKTALFLKGTTRSKEKANFAQAALAAVRKKGLADPGAVVAETIAVVRAKQDWDSAAEQLTRSR